MAGKWSGPRNLVQIRGMVDSADLVPSDYGADRVQVVLVDVAQTYDEGDPENLETRTLFVSQGGAPGKIFADSIRKVAGLPPRSDTILEAIEGQVIQADVSTREFTNRQTGEQGTMTLYRVTSIGDGGHAKSFSLDDVAAFVIGKTPVEVAKGRTQFAGSDYPKALANRTTTLKLLGDTVKLVEGKYQKA